MVTAAIATNDYSQEQVGLLKRTVCKGATDDEFLLFISQCRRTGLDPFARQIHAVKRWDRQQNREVMAIQTGIDGYRLIAERTGLYAGNDDPVYDKEDADHPNKATVTVWKLVEGQRVAFTRSARWKEFVQTKKDGTVTQFWARMPYLMLGKVAEALALRAAFPQELAGIYTNEEMQQAGETEAEHAAPEPKQVEAPKPLPPKAETKPEKPTSDVFAERLKQCKTLEELASIWDAIPTQHHKALAPFKDTMKARLVRIETPQAENATGDGDAHDDDNPEPQREGYAGRDLRESISLNLGELGIGWDEVRDNFGNGLGLADIAGFMALMNIEIHDLLAEQALKLNLELARRVAAKRIAAKGKAAVSA